MTGNQDQSFCHSNRVYKYFTYQSNHCIRLVVIVFETIASGSAHKGQHNASSIRQGIGSLRISTATTASKQPRKQMMFAVGASYHSPSCYVNCSRRVCRGSSSSLVGGCRRRMIDFRNGCRSAVPGTVVGWVSAWHSPRTIPFIVHRLVHARRIRCAIPPFSIPGIVAVSIIVALPTHMVSVTIHAHCPVHTRRSRRAILFVNPGIVAARTVVAIPTHVISVAVHAASIVRVPHSTAKVFIQRSRYIHPFRAIHTELYEVHKTIVLLARRSGANFRNRVRHCCLIVPVRRELGDGIRVGLD
jgi:hypothetical protein